MIIKTNTIKFATKGDFDIVDVTSRLQAAVCASGVSDGMVNVFAPGATGAVTAIECESGLLEDFRDFFEKIIPTLGEYKHNLSHAARNGHSHVRASLIGPDMTIPVRKGQVFLGVWQRIVFIDTDSCPRERELMVTVMGGGGKNG
ncbi:MAG: secondary thiamine-phosphate synthase enzyme [Elusimicrobia bacterium HGW-Elusimicrobia-2]|nr:MAG: secondary thiamine-phosphate synthase enzyme [Elusimicrobia bacterium HGW-Elusimicrobia-2]